MNVESPASSMDLSSLGFFLLGNLGSVLYAKHPQTKETVKKNTFKINGTKPLWIHCMQVLRRKTLNL